MKKSTKLKQQIKKLEQENDKNEFLSILRSLSKEMQRGRLRVE